MATRVAGSPTSAALRETGRQSLVDRASARAVGPLLFGVRLWASVCLALYVAFVLQLAQPSWAGTTAALVCQPQLGASLRKSWFRLVGTAVGGVAMVLLSAAFPQDRIGFLGGLALWAAATGFAGSLLTNFAAYGAGLAGFTAAVIAADILGPTGGADAEAATFALDRVVEIVLGIVCAGVVLALTDLGGARRRLGTAFAATATAAVSGFVGVVSAADPDGPAARAGRRETMRRVIALDPTMDTAIGEASDLRNRSRILQAGVSGLVTTLTAWRTLAIHLGARSRSPQARTEVAPIARLLLGVSRTPDEALRDPAGLRDACAAAARAAVRREAGSPSVQLVADAAALGLRGAARALNALTLIVDPARAREGDAPAAFFVPDWLPPSIVAVRAFATTGLVSLFWILTAWPSGPTAITFAVIAVVLFPLQGDRAWSSATSFLAGCAFSAVLAGSILFGVLPSVASFAGLSLTLGVVFVPLGVLIAWPWKPVAASAAAFIVPFLSLQNVQVYDAAQFANSVLAIVGGVAAGAMMIRLVPPPSPETRARRLLRFALRDVRRLAGRRRRLSGRAWETRALARVIALPDGAAPIDRAHMASTLAVGARVLRLREAAPRFAPAAAVEAALAPIAEGRVAAALEGLSALNRALTSASATTRLAMRLRAATLAIGEELTAYPEFFAQPGRT